MTDLAAIWNSERQRVLATLIRLLGDFDLAEEALHEAFLAAAEKWPRTGVPGNPFGWLVSAGRFRAIDQMRRAARLVHDLPDIAAPESPADWADDGLRLIFTCCHPALEPKTQVALTLRTVCGLTTAGIAAVFLDSEPAMAQRLSRARAKIAAARISYAVPGPGEWPGRLGAVLTVVYLIFTTGYAGGPGEEARDLCDEAVFLARLLDALRPGDPEVEGCLALLLLTHSRRAARRDAAGQTVPPGRQDAALWDAPMRAAGLAHLDRAMARGAAGPFQIKAAIAACQMVRPGPDWPQIALLYDRLLRFEPTPVVRLNRAVALMECGDMARAGGELTALAAELAQYQPFHAARAEWLARSGRRDEALAAFAQALTGAGPADSAFLRARIASLAG